MLMILDYNKATRSTTSVPARRLHRYCTVYVSNPSSVTSRMTARLRSIGSTNDAKIGQQAAVVVVSTLKTAQQLSMSSLKVARIVVDVL